MKRWWLAGVYVAAIDCGCALDQRIEHLRCAMLECHGVTDFNDQRFVRSKIVAGHAVSMTDVGQAVNPGIHVSPVELRESEDGRALSVEGVPAIDAPALKLSSRQRNASRVQFTPN